ncbi:c-type cytochrome biogenesis protein CcmI [Nocardia yamanashiensis]|uniref:c-type cytochrome biogenesis protein CcmI n=1 Tax=Nocardia yamanashiensis TaxID=209247 RepID=UPI001E5FD544|nr:c-type cytochrome biogenesis protein CcmI [Nocardia yamanashiensis]UGT44790.1 c-type cytochrome biogenesis protein CcmI [Nocardia yamanashiensis]
MIGTLLGLPLLPVRGVVALARMLAEEVDKELYGMTAIRRQLDELERARAAGQLDEAEYQRAEQEVLSRLLNRKGSGGGH